MSGLGEKVENLKKFLRRPGKDKIKTNHVSKHTSLQKTKKRNQKQEFKIEKLIVIVLYAKHI